MSNSCSILLCSKHIQPTAINHAHPTLTDKCLCTLSVSDQTPLIFTLKTFVPTTDVYNLSWKFWAHWSSIWRKTCVLALYFLLLSNSMLYQIQRMQWFKSQYQHTSILYFIRFALLSFDSSLHPSTLFYWASQVYYLWASDSACRSNAFNNWSGSRLKAAKDKRTDPVSVEWPALMSVETLAAISQPLHNCLFNTAVMLISFPSLRTQKLSVPRLDGIRYTHFTTSINLDTECSMCELFSLT